MVFGSLFQMKNSQPGNHKEICPFNVPFEVKPDSEVSFGKQDEDEINPNHIEICVYHMWSVESVCETV